MIGGIVSFLMSGLGQIVVAGVGALALWAAFKFHYEGKGAARERARIEHAGARNAKRAAKIRTQVDALPDNALRDAWFRD